MRKSHGHAENPPRSPVDEIASTPTIVLKSTDTQRLMPRPNKSNENATQQSEPTSANAEIPRTRSEQKLTLLVQDTPLAVVEWDRDFHVVEWNRAAERIFGYSRAAAVGGCVLDLFADDDNRRTTRDLWNALLAGQRSNRHTAENIRADGQIIFCEWHSTSIEDGTGKVIGGASMAQDITHRKRAEARLLQQALHDSLTGLPNRSLFRQRLERRISRRRTPKDRDFAVLFLDIDRFKVINDSLGHLVGDRLLVEISRRLESCLRASDFVYRVGEHTIARLGGDEFTILLDDVSDEAIASRVAERIQEVLKEPFLLDGHQVFTSASIGIALSNQDYGSADELLRDADIAMYEAKSRGKARHVLFDTQMRARAMARLSMETALRRGIDAHEFVVHYQPIIEHPTGRIQSAEALVRWMQPELGLIKPDEFIPLAEETGLILAIGDWVIETACRQMIAWQADLGDRAPSRLCVNLSGKQFKQGDLVTKLTNVLRETGLDPSCVSLEITESEIMLDARPAIETLRALRAMGLHLCIDDFGTGYSSLSYLQQFPTSTLKIDRSFIAGMESNSDNLEIVRAIVNLARTLEKTVIAEGVETQNQFHRLIQLDCSLFQGNLLHAAMPADQMTDVLAHGAVRLP